MAQADFLIIPLKRPHSYLDEVLEEEEREKARRREQLERFWQWWDEEYSGSDQAFWDMVCGPYLGLEER